MTTISIHTMSDRELLDLTARAACSERHATAELLALIGELDARRLYLGEGCSSLFTYCTQVLQLSEHAAYHRIEAARAARRFPIILRLVADGSATLTTVALLRPHLTPANHKELLTAARHRTKREVEHQIACLSPQPDAKTLVRRLPETPCCQNLAPALLADTSKSISARPTPIPAAAVTANPRPKMTPLASDRYLLRVTLSDESHAKLRRAQQLMGHSLPSGDLAIIIDKALSLLVTDLERVRIGKVHRPRARSATQPSPSSSGSRHIPAALRRKVWARDEGRCAFAGSGGRCTETGRLEFHHVIPFSRGGPTSLENLALRCRAHNNYESEQVFGRWPGRAVTPREVQPSLIEG